MIELLSPAGNKKAFIAAVQAGADAIYMGINKYNARAMTENFEEDEYIWCIEYAHKYNVKVYLTLNILFYTNEIEDAISLVERLYKKGLDAVIIQDIALISLLKSRMPNLDIHASTQMTAHNLKQVEYLKKIGFSRVVLARELTIDEIEEIAINTDVELEVFVHGALCVSYSGQCLMSSMIGNRSGNRGKCAGTCRMEFNLFEKNKQIEKGNLLSKKDIYGIEYIDRLKRCNVKSLKIEGRGKSYTYVALVTSKYKKYLNGEEFTKLDEKELLQMFNRTSKSFGYFEKVGSKESISYKVAKNTGILLGKVLDIKGNLVKLKLEEDIDMHDGIEAFENNTEVSTVITCVRNEKMELINNLVEKNNIVWLGDFKKKPKIRTIAI